MVNRGLRGWIDFLLPGACLLCGARLPAGDDLCPACEAELPRLGPACAACAAPLPRSPAGLALRCAPCQQTAPAFDRTVALFAYAAPVDRLILRLKYHADLRLARVLGNLLAAAVCAQAGGIPDLIVPVPLHVTRLRERGYNQALELARPIARRLRAPLDYRSVARVRRTAPQVDMDYEARRKNVRRAFRVNADLTARRIAIVDDVMTSGHTVNALAAALRKAGAAEVAVWVVARA
jgi:ComF family protein